MTGFYSHRKTARLKAKIGMNALWLPPRLWAYCAENQPDGDLSGYQADEVAMLVGYEGDATSMLQALKDCGFMDLEGRIHDWMEHNGYHQKFSDRAKTAANARWSKPKPPQTPPEVQKEKVEKESGDKHCSSMSQALLVASEPPPVVDKPPRAMPFIKPTLQEMIEEGKRIGLPQLQSERCWHYYESNGWRVGKNAMKNWHSVMRTWKGKYMESGGAINGKPAEKSHYQPL